MKKQNTFFSAGGLCILISIVGFGLAIATLQNRPISIGVSVSLAVVSVGSFIFGLALDGESIFRRLSALGFNNVTPRWLIMWLFCGALSVPALFLAVSWTVRGNLGAALMFGFWTLLYFPSGLAGYYSDSKNIIILAVFGYAVYAALFTLAMFLRRNWQTCFLWIVFVLLIVLNGYGCKAVVDRTTSGMTIS